MTDIYTVAPNAIPYNSINTNGLNLKSMSSDLDYYGPLFIKGSYTVYGLYDGFVTNFEGDGTVSFKAENI
jgi:hypothetical protein